MRHLHNKPFFSSIWLAGLVNLAAACVVTCICFLDVIVHPHGSWTTGEPAPFTYRAPSNHDPVSAELLALLDRDSPSRGRFIVRRGEPVSRTHLTRLQRLLPGRKHLDLRRLGGVLVFVWLALTFYSLLLRRYGSHLLLRLRAMVSVYLSLLVVVLASRLLLSHTPVSMYALPVAFTAILFTPRMGKVFGLVTHLLALALVAPMISYAPGMVLIPLVAGWSALLLLDSESGPVRMVLASVAGALVGGLFLTGLDLFTLQSVDYGLRPAGDLVGVAGGSLVSGLGAALLAYPATVMFGDVPRTRLRALLEMDHPLLKDLAEKAPGTFQHSLAMANMAEKVADDIGADNELVRAGAYYHDIGKMHEPKYFIENQQGDNPHDKLDPAASAVKLRDHVAHGLTIARGANLPERIIDFLVEHHGRSTMEFFLDKAYRENGKVSDPDLFHYQGRNPTSRETAILMIVDAVEAASRTLREPSQDDIENLVRRIIFGKLLHGYLDESGLTTRDLRQVGISLIKFLQGQFHVRVEYPWQKKEPGRPPLQVVPDSQAGVAAPPASQDAPPRVVSPVAPPVDTAQAAEEPDAAPSPAPEPASTAEPEHHEE